MNEELFLSIIVIGRNEGNRLIKCFESIFNAQPPYGNWEILYVDSESTDGSSLKAAALGIKVIEIPAQNATPGAARNAGWRKAKGNYIFFLDGDTILNPDFILEALPLFSDPHVAVVCGQRKELYPNDSIYNRVMDLDWNGPSGDVEACGGDAIVRRTVLEDVDGYDPFLAAGEEPEMCRRIREKGYRIVRMNTLMTHHDLGMHCFSQYWKRAFRTGYAYAEVSDRYKLTKDPTWKKEASHNLWKGSFFLLAALLCFTSKWILLGVFLIGSLMIARSAWKVREKANAITTCFLYGAHAHFQHIPLFFGQLAYWIDRWRGKKRIVINYKK